ncbi:MAG TPA: hypothetical protein VE981_20185 [Planctomycetota bacterium]|nr:hypothetical protein [Planctomycetota bacterium]
MRREKLARIAATGLLLALVLVSPRALLQPVEIVHKSQDSNRPKIPKNVLRAEPVRVPTAEKQGNGPGLSGSDPVSEGWFAGFSGLTPLQAVRARAFTQLTKPEYLKCFASGAPPVPLAPPA